MPSSSLEPLSFLILEDNANMATIVKAILKGFGAVKIYEACDVAQAFQVCRHGPVDVALVDCHLGFMDGVAFVRLIRTAVDSPNPFMPIVMVSAYSEESRVTAARDAGATDFCVKPVTPIELFRKIADVIDHPREFIRNGSFFGPCRRRHADEAYAGPERRTAAPAADPVEAEATAA